MEGKVDGKMERERERQNKKEGEDLLFILDIESRWENEKREKKRGRMNNCSGDR